jgi:hypothetical protein
VDNSKPIFTRPSEKALQKFRSCRSSGVAEVGGGHWGLQGEKGNASNGRHGREFSTADENDDFPTVACDLR